MSDSFLIRIFVPKKTDAKMRSEERLIFLTNDDGYDAPGFAAAIEMARKFGHVAAIAPETTRSGMSQAITMHDPLYLRQIPRNDDIELYAFSGTPVDCVKMAFDHLFRNRKVDLVLSGINHGSNSATNVLYSGTMGAAIEGSFYGCPAVGLSLCDHSRNADFTAAVHYGSQILSRIFESGVQGPLCLNVNVPVAAIDEIKGIRVCRQTRGFWREEFFRREDPRGREYYWLTGEFVNSEPEAADSDEHALANGFVTIVPVQADMTDYGRMEELKSVF